MNIYKKILTISKEFMETNPKKSGQNKYAGFKYFTLEDLSPLLIRLMDKYNLYIEFNFSETSAKATIINIDAPEETREITSPMPKLDLKGANAIQEMGGQQTYIRRYFLLNIFHISEPDFFDATLGKDEKEIKEIIKTKIRKTVKEGEMSARDINAQYPELKHLDKMNIKELRELNSKIFDSKI